LDGNGNGENYPNKDEVFLDIYGHHHHQQNKIHQKKESILMILQIINVMIVHVIYQTCKLNFVDRRISNKDFIYIEIMNKNNDELQTMMIKNQEREIQYHIRHFENMKHRK
jgi:hypothetical protein